MLSSRTGAVSFLGIGIAVWGSATKLGVEHHNASFEAGQEPDRGEVA